MIWIFGLTATWVLLTGVFTIDNIILGFALGSFLLWLGQGIVIGQNNEAVKSDAERFKQLVQAPTLWEFFSEIGSLLSKVSHVARFIIFFLKEVIIANMDVMLLVLSPRMSFLRPAIIEFELKKITSPIAITLLANMITLTPGTLSLAVSKNRTALFVHCVYVDDEKEKIEELRVFESAIANLIDEVLK